MGGILKKELQIIIIAIALLLFSFNVSAAAVGHAASAISSEQFESGNYTFINYKPLYFRGETL